MHLRSLRPPQPCWDLSFNRSAAAAPFSSPMRPCICPVFPVLSPVASWYITMHCRNRFPVHVLSSFFGYFLFRVLREETSPESLALRAQSSPPCPLYLRPSSSSFWPVLLSLRRDVLLRCPIAFRAVYNLLFRRLSLAPRTPSPLFLLATRVNPVFFLTARVSAFFSFDRSDVPVIQSPAFAPLSHRSTFPFCRWSQLRALFPFALFFPSISLPYGLPIPKLRNAGLLKPFCTS